MIVVKNQPKPGRPRAGTVYLAMSGGVDSSLSAALLKEKGYNVVGVFIKTWHPPYLECPWKEDRLDALRVATHLDIPFKTVNLSKEYKKEVIDYLLLEYRKGRTPNPDVMCNKTIKFGAFFKWALTNGADCVATGHYAHIKKNDEVCRLYRGKDSTKDQTYFLWNLKQRHLRKTLFPIGHLKKDDVRKEAQKRGLFTATKKDSQGLCFVGKIDFKKFLKRYIKPHKGNVLNQKGDVIGSHEGAVFYTIGERHGFTITQKTPNDAPYYVVSKNMKKNEIVVSQKNTLTKSARAQVELIRSNWILGTAPSQNKSYSCQIRYRQKPLPGKLLKKKGLYVFRFKIPQTGIAPGQSLVLYDGKECLGGGVIQYTHGEK